MVMDRTTLLDPDYPPKYKPYLERRIPKHFHLLVQHLTMRNPSKRPCAKVILKVCSNIFEVGCRLYAANCGIRPNDHWEDAPHFIYV